MFIFIFTLFNIGKKIVYFKPIVTDLNPITSGFAFWIGGTPWRAIRKETVNAFLSNKYYINKNPHTNPIQNFSTIRNTLNTQ